MRLSRRKIVLIGILIVVFFLIGVTAIQNRQLIGLIALPSHKYEPTKIPVDTTELFEYDGYIKNDLVYIYVQGGPNWELFDRELSPFTWMPHSGTYIKVFPYQSQIINPTILAATPILTSEQVQSEVMTSAEILYRTVLYFKNRNKKVYVYCVSHGSQIGLEMIRNHPNICDGLALTLIRLNLDEKAIEITKNGKVPYFDSNQKITSRYLLPRFLQFSRIDNRIDNMCMMMQISRNRYTELLKDKDMSNVVFVYGKNDTKVGRLNKNELDFLKNKKVKILELDCGHDDLGGSDYIEQINRLLFSNK